MTDTLRNIPRYIRNTDAFGWQGADNPDGPWRSITPPQSGSPWQQGRTPMDNLRQASAEVSGVEVLSPAAQAVLDAFANKIADNPLNWLPRYALAAALRAAADQVVPPALEEEFFDRNHALPLQKMVEIRLNLLAIAAELESNLN